MATRSTKPKADKVDTKTPRKPGAKARRDWKPKFLKALRESANVRSACEKARISRQTAYDARKSDPAFAAQWDSAEEDACDLLETRAWERSKSSDTLLMFLLRAHRPNKFAERSRSENLNVDLTTLNDKQLELLANGASITTVLAAASAGGDGTPSPAAGEANRTGEADVAHDCTPGTDSAAG